MWCCYFSIRIRSYFVCYHNWFVCTSSPLCIWNNQLNYTDYILISFFFNMSLAMCFIFHDYFCCYFSLSILFFEFRGQYTGTFALTSVQIHTRNEKTKKKKSSTIHTIKHKSKRQTFTGRSNRNIDSIVLCCAELAKYSMACLCLYVIFMYVFVCACVCECSCADTYWLYTSTNRRI